MSKRERKGKNYLDLIPVRNPEFSWEEENGVVTVLVENKGFFNRLAQKFWGKPKISYIHLDELGSFIWRHIDGTSSVYEIADALRGQYGERVEPLYERLVAHMRNLEKYQFILAKVK